MKIDFIGCFHCYLFRKKNSLIEEALESGEALESEEALESDVEESTNQNEKRRKWPKPPWTKRKITV